MQQGILDFFAETKAKLMAHQREHGGESAVAYDKNRISDLDWPHYWREEADTQEEYLIRYGRGLGVYVVFDYATGNMRCRLTRDAADEATITWPGKTAE